LNAGSCTGAEGRTDKKLLKSSTDYHLEDLMKRFSISLPRALVALCGVLFAVALHAPASAQNPARTKLRVSVVPIIDTAALHAAIHNGYFAAEGLEIDISPAVGGAAGLPALAAGQVQIAFSNIVSTSLAASQGLGFKIIAPAATAPDAPPEGTGLVVAHGSKIRSGKDLEGKRVAVNNRANIIWLYSRAWVEATGGNPAKVTYLEVPFPQMVDALKSGQIDAAVLVDPFLSAGLENKVIDLVGWPYNKVQKGMSISQYVTTDAFLKSNPKAVEGFVRALNKGIVWMNQNAGKPEWIKVISGFTKLPEERLKKLAVAPFKTSIDPKSIDASLALMRKHGLLSTPLSAAQLLYAPAAARN
jgi:NitT/TauT family transport system substrate-binding protein